jgi:hypothetical protein
MQAGSAEHARIGRMQSPGKVSATLLLSIIALPCASSAAYLLSMLCRAVEIAVSTWMRSRFGGTQGHCRGASPVSLPCGRSVNVFIRYQTLNIEESGVGPVCGNEQIG